MSEIDPLIFEFKAKVDGYLSSLRSTTTRVDQLVGTQEARIRQLETEFKRSSGAISGHLRSIATGVAGALGAREVAQMADGYTRFTNALRVAGLESENLAATQETLFGVAQKYGVELEAVGSLYSRAAQSQQALGASSADLIRLTESVSASLKILPADAGAVSGAMTQLGQALASPKVQAEEFNSVVDVLTPLMQEAAKHIEGTGGTLAGLKNKLKDTKGPGLSNVELFRGMTAALETLQGTAERSGTTIAASFTRLNNALGKYIGQADQTLSATERFASGIALLADNLDTVIPILAAVAVGLGARYVAGAVAASVATGALGVATFALQARMLGAATSAEALSFALNGLRLNPIGLAITALAGGIGYMIVKSYEADKATGAFATAQDEAAKASDRAKNAVDQLANAQGKAREEALAQAKAEAKNTEAKLAGARASVALAQAELARARSFQAAQNVAATGSTGVPGTGTFIQGTGDKRVALAAANKKAADDTVASLERSLAKINAAIGNAANPIAVPTAAGGTPGTRGRAASGPSPEDIRRRFNDELAGYMSQTNSAMASIATSAEQQAEYELRNVELSRIRTIDGIKASDDYSAARKKQLIAQVEVLADAERERIAFNLRAQQERAAADLADSQFNSARDALQALFDLADTQDERRRLALEILDLEYQHKRQVLQAIIDSQTAARELREQAAQQLEALTSSMDMQRAVVERRNAGPLETWARQNGQGYDTQARAEEAVVAELERVRDGIHGALSEAIGVKDPLISFLLDNLLQEVLFKPIANALSQSRGGGGSGGGFLGSLVSAGLSFFGRASGGRVNAGQVYRVNEAASPGNVELFRPDVGGEIIPLGRTNAVQAGGQQSGGTVRIIVEEAPGFASRVQAEATGVAIEVVRASAPGLIDASANETMRRAQRPRI
ncbi:tape measure protein [Novosphingobium sp.]|uniref:tape measure protein n=1 Tax=Novosphingobium sp. TaxID=1874826 RepID=UPI002604A08C|nr:tape measure protein [Novosphingobium sp.]